ncbi:hypothetical protein [Porphyromonas levii]|uniref:hypothetical protein n=1 Tax=Porphyromonas levii TaxID=28114 RepID=UPI001BAA3D6A|nr:hypothetical protein [Porphyromonas levii]MBR8801918.1 hypothetical protein [Porphyromonas levii]
MKTSLQQIHPSNWKDHPSSSIWMIVDWDGEFFRQDSALIPRGAGGCCVYIPESLPQGIDISRYSAKIHSKEPMEMTSLGLRRNAWRPKQGLGQCDAILLPTSDNIEDALLLVETKYSENDDSWQSYKDHALKQITDTISQLLNNHCPTSKRNLYGLISCPLLDTIGASAFSPEELMDIYNQHRLSIHMGNSAKFQDAQTISFTD